MGLTHYWEIKDADKWASVYDDIVSDVRRIVDFVEERPEWMGYGKRNATNQDFRYIESHFEQNAVAIAGLVILFPNSSIWIVHQ